MMTDPDGPPFLVTLGFDPDTFDRLDSLRKRYFPPNRNQIPAHLSLFHHLPSSGFEEIDDELARAARKRPPISLRFGGLKRMSRGVMIQVDAPGLPAIHSNLSAAFRGHLTPQDRQPFRPHVVVMNKAEPDDAAGAFAELTAGWAPWTGQGTHLLLWRYLGGPWDLAAEYPLDGAQA